MAHEMPEAVQPRCRAPGTSTASLAHTALRDMFLDDARRRRALRCARAIGRRRIGGERQFASPPKASAASPRRACSEACQTEPAAGRRRPPRRPRHRSRPPRRIGRRVVARGQLAAAQPQVGRPRSVARALDGRRDVFVKGRNENAASSAGSAGCRNPPARDGWGPSRRSHSRRHWRAA